MEDQEGKPKKRAPKKKASSEDDAKLGPNERAISKTAEYKIILNDDKKEADLHFTLVNAVEDRYFAYALTLMDLFRTLEGVRAVAPPEVIEEFETALHVLKGMSESIKRKIEEDAGFVKPLLNDKRKEDLKKIIGTIKDKIQKKFPGAKIGFTEINGEGNELPDIIKSIVKEIQNEMGEIDDTPTASKAKPKKTSKSKLEDNARIVEPKKPSKDLEL